MTSLGFKYLSENVFCVSNSDVTSYVFKKELKCSLYPSCDVIGINCLIQTEVIFEYKADLSRTAKCDQNHITDKNAFSHT